ncbi:CdaA regulatory protein CdaR [Clostridia bacterium]|nr:CdaA regulatory protein CdaR [Clostridia bacterium]
MNSNASDTADNKAEKKKGHDIPLKIFSLLAAILIWFWIIGFESQVSEKTFTRVPVITENFEAMKQKYNYSILLDKELFVDVTLSGKYSDLNRVNPTDLIAFVDLAQVDSPGEILLPIEVKDIDYVELVSVSQSNTTMYIDRVKSVNVRVDVAIVQIIKSAEVDIGTAVPSPASITVTGPEGIVNNIDHAQVNISFGSEAIIERTMNVTEQFKLIDKSGNEVQSRYVTSQESSVNVLVPVTTTKEIPLTVSYKFGYWNEKNTKITLIPETIKVKASPDVFKTLTEISVGRIDEKKYDSDVDITMTIPLPEGVENVSGVTSLVVHVEFINMETRTLTIPASRYKVTPPQGMRYRIKEPDIQIKLIGPKNVLQLVMPTGIDVKIDLASYTDPGTYTVPIDVSVISGVQVYPVGEYSVSVEIFNREETTVGGNLVN